MRQDDRRAEPGGRAPAPGPLALVQDFVNTVDLEDAEDQLGDAAALTAWLTQRALLPRNESIDETGYARVIAVREALRAQLAANNGEPLDADAAAVVNAAAEAAHLVVRFASNGQTATLEPAAGGVDGALGRILAAAYAAVETGTWPRLKACRRHICRWAFYDASKNRSGSWCSMAICGNRTKTRTYRRRHQRA